MSRNIKVESTIEPEHLTGKYLSRDVLFRLNSRALLTYRNMSDDDARMRVFEQDLQAFRDALIMNSRYDVVYSGPLVQSTDDVLTITPDTNGMSGSQESRYLITISVEEMYRCIDEYHGKMFPFEGAAYPTDFNRRVYSSLLEWFIILLMVGIGVLAIRSLVTLLLNITITIQ